MMDAFELDLPRLMCNEFVHGLGPGGGATGRGSGSCRRERSEGRIQVGREGVYVYTGDNGVG